MRAAMTPAYVIAFSTLNFYFDYWNNQKWPQSKEIRSFSRGPIERGRLNAAQGPACGKVKSENNGTCL